MATSHIACPRCGYDLSGAVDAWGEACPLTGVCSECGYGFEWGRALARARGVELALYEVAPSRALPALVRSVAMAFRPRALWREAIRGEPIRLRRLGAVLGLGLLASHLLMTLVFQLVAIGGRVIDVSWGTQERLVELLLMYPAHPVAFGLLAGNATICLLLVVASFFADDERFRTEDVVRASVYWLATVPLMAGAAELVLLINLDSLVLQFHGPMRSLARDAAPSVTGFALAALYGWMWYWWAAAFRQYFQIPHPLARSFMATAGFIAAAVATWASANLISAVLEFTR